MDKIKAIIFDLDGTLIDSEYFHFTCWNETLHEFNIELEFDSYLKNYAGIPAPLNSVTLANRYHLSVAADKLSNRKEKITEEKLRTSGIRLMPGAGDALEYFHTLGILVIIVTGSPRKDVDFILSDTKIGRYIQFTITRDDVAESKPNPEPYLRAIEKSGYTPKELLVFEDSQSGIEAAKLSELKCFAIQNNPGLHEKLTLADEIFENFNSAIKHLEKENLINTNLNHYGPQTVCSFYKEKSK